MNLEPFPHVVLNDWIDRQLLVDVAREIIMANEDGWRRYRNDREHKDEGGPSVWGPAAHDYFVELGARTDELGEMFGIDDLQMETVGGGYHLIPPGGRLEMHTDFNRSPSSGRYRRLNVLTYLNEDWDDEGGHLLLGADRSVSIAPEMGRTVAFATSETSWHGHPIPARRRRLSIAAYFFTDEPPATFTHEHSTIWLETA